MMISRGNVQQRHRNPNSSKPHVLSQVFPSLQSTTSSTSRELDRKPRHDDAAEAEQVKLPSIVRSRSNSHLSSSLEPMGAPFGAELPPPTVTPPAAAATKLQGSNGKSKRTADPLDTQVSHYHRLLTRKISTKFGSLRRVFRKIDADASGSCDRDELKYMLNAMFNLKVPNAVMDRMIDLADHNGDGSIKFDECASS